MLISNKSPVLTTTPNQRTAKLDLTLNGDGTEGGAETAFPENTALPPTPSALQASTEPHALEGAQQSAARDADDKIIAAWFKLLKPNAGKHTDTLHSDPKDDDPGRVPDPLYEPTKEHVPDSLKIITFNDLMRAIAPKKPHWKHYDDVSTQYQVGSQDRDQT